mgnify:CR=1 FL=1
MNDMDFDDKKKEQEQSYEREDEPSSSNAPDDQEEFDTFQPHSSEPSTTSSPNETGQETREKRKKWHGISAVVGGLIGGVVAAIIVALIFVNVGGADGQDQTSSKEDTNVAPEIVETLATEDAEVSTNIEEVSSAVVGVVNMQQRSIWEGNEEAGTGSGIIYKKENGKAYVVTNQHVVNGAEHVEVVLDDEERLPATVLGQDALTDLAVLEIDGETIDTVAQIGSSSDLVVGETVLAIGNPLGLEFANTITKGIISGLNRSVPVDTNQDGQPDWVTEVLQTDAAINPGNSGGALVNAEGEVIGINSMKIAKNSVEGIGFAIPVDTALPIMEQLETEGEVTRPLIGISTAALYQVPPQYRYEINLPEDVEGGMVIAHVEPRTPADRAGLQQFDVITKINGQPVTSILELRKYLYSETTVGDEIEVEYIRDGKVETTKLILEEINQDDAA